MTPESDREYAATLATAIDGLRAQRNALTKVRNGLEDVQREFQPDLQIATDGITHASAGGASCIISSMYNDIERLKNAHGTVRARIDNAQPLRYGARGPGLNWIPCCICGEDNNGNAQPDMAAHVDSKQAGEAVVDLFVEMGLSAKLDFRPSEPNWVQVKIGACETHREFLTHLCYQTRYGTIDPEAIRVALSYATAVSA